MFMKRKSVAFSVLILLCICGLFAEGKQEEKENGEITLKMIAPWSDDELEGFLPVLEAFESENPNINVEYRTGRAEDVATMLLTQFSINKTPADVIDIAWSWFIKQEAGKGNILSLNDVINANDYREGSMSPVTINNQFFGVPSVGGLTVPEYNASLYRENGLKELRSLNTWEEWIETFDTLMKLPTVKSAFGSGGGIGYTNTSVIETILLTYGDRELYMDLVEGKESWISDRVLNIMRENLLPLLQEGYFGEPEEISAVREAMWNKEYAVFIGGTTDSLRFNEPPGDWAICTFPGQKSVTMWTDYWFAPKYTEHPEESKKLIQFLATTGQSIQIKGGGRIASYTKVEKENYPPQEQMCLDVIDGLSVVPDIDDVIGGEFQVVMWDQLKLLWAEPTEDTLKFVFSNMQNASEETLKK